MKLNGGRGWEVIKSHPSAHHLGHQANAPPEASARALRDAPGARGSDGRPMRPDARGAISADRLNAAQPPPPGSPAKPGVAAMGKNARDRTSAGGGGALPKRSSGLAGQLDVVTPAASTQAQFQNSNANLAANHTKQSAAAGALQGHQGRPQQQQQEPQQTFVQKLMNALCCGSGMFSVTYGRRSTWLTIV
jgi:casein kinase 1